MVAQTNDSQLVLSTIRTLVADLVQEYKGGHPGTPMGAAAVGVSLWKDVMRFNPADPLWANRDRFVLSAGHACLLQYLMLHFSGYKDWTLDEIKRYHSRDFVTSRAAGHPEYEQSAGIEITTGPLGQGLANSVGLAIAAKQMSSRYGQPGYEGLFDHKIWAFTGDGCLQEGVGQESISMAGHLGLDNLILIYDVNKITVDGTIDNCFTEDVPVRFKSAGWNVMSVDPTTTDDAQEQIRLISETLNKARQHKGEPTLVVIPTVIGFGSKKQNTGPVHGAALGDEDVAHVKEAFGFDPKQKYVVSPKVYEYFSNVPSKGAKLQEEWETLYKKYSTEYPEQYNEIQRRMTGKLPEGWEKLLPAKKDLPTAPQPTRKSSGIVVSSLAPLYPDIIAGSADLLESTFVNWKGMTEFQKPSSGLGDHSGRQIRFGVREFSMAGIANGIAAYFPHILGAQGGGFLPVYSTFFMFHAYALPAIRMAALQKLKTVAIGTHDSIGIGEDGPTHQPIALAAFFRGLPGLRLWRPADAEETIAAWQYTIEQAQGPTVLCFTRQAVPLQDGSDRKQVWKGAYPLTSEPNPSLVLVATGSEVALAVETAKVLSAAPYNIKTRVVSAPCLELFDEQPRDYRLDVIPSNKALVVSIEAWAAMGWARYAHASMSMSTFGHSGPQADLFEYFGFSVNNAVKKIGDYYNRHLNADGSLNIPSVGEFEDLLLGQVHGWK